MSSTTAVCTYFLRDACNRGTACLYSHDADPSGFQGENTSPPTDCPDFTQDTEIVDTSCVNFSPAADGGDGTSTASFCDRQTSPARQQCLFFSQGKCTKGDACAYSHVPGSARQGPCKFFGDGKCLKGESCSFLHTGNEFSAPFDGSQPSCKFFSHGKCFKGHLCTFKHIAAEEAINLIPHDTSVRHPCKFFSEGKCNKGNACTFSHASFLGPALAANHVFRAPYEATPQACVFFSRGICKNGDACAFPHSSTIKQPQVGFIAGPSYQSPPRLHGEEPKSPADDHTEVDVGSTTPTPSSVRQEFSSKCCRFCSQGQCKNGDDCIFRHDPFFAQGGEEAPVEVFSWRKDSRAGDLDGQMPPSAGLSYRCKFFDQGRCLNGASCRFTHDAQTLSSDPPHRDTTAPEAILSAPEESQGNFSSNCLQVDDNDPNSWSSPANGDISAEAGSAAQQISSVYCKFYPQDRCKNGDDCVFHHDPSLAQRSEEAPVEEFSWGRDCWVDTSNGQTQPSTGRIIGRCKFFDQGHCSKGTSCRFTHDAQTLSSDPPHHDTTAPEAIPSAPEESQGNFSSNCLQVDDNDLNTWSSPVNGDISAEAGPAAQQTSFVYCKFYPQGRCKNGNDCFFHHDPSVAQQIEEAPTEDFSWGRDCWGTSNGQTQPSTNRIIGRCKFFDQGRCSKGTSCRFTHQVETLSSDPLYRDATAAGNDSSTQMAGGDKRSSPINGHTPIGTELSVQDVSSECCKLYSQGNCKDGDNCAFRHDPSFTRWGGESTDDVTGWGDWGEASGDWGEANRGDDLGGQRRSSRGQSYGRCKYFDEGRCRKGTSCRFTHQVDTFSSDPLYHDATPGNDGSTQLVGDDVKWPSPINGRTSIGTESSAQDVSSEYCKFYSQGDCKDGDNCVFRHDPSFTRWGGESTDDVAGWGDWGEACKGGDLGEQRPSPRGQSRGRCKYFDQGHCNKGTSCRFTHQVDASSSEPLHDGAVSERVAGSQGSEGSSWVNVACRNDNHSRMGIPAGPAMGTCKSLDSEHCTNGFKRRPVHAGVNHRTSESPHTDCPDCWDFSRGNCNRGDTCKFRHAVADVLFTGRAADPLVDDDYFWEKNSWPVGNTGGSEGHSTDTQIEKGKFREHGASSPPFPDHADSWSTESSPENGPTTPSSSRMPVAQSFGGCLSLHHWGSREATRVGISNHHDLPVRNNTLSPKTIFRYTDSEEITVERPMFNCTVRFGRAAVVQDVITAFESCQVVLSNLPADVTEANITSLTEPFGNTTMILVENPPMTPPIAHVNYAQHAHASQAVSCLNSTDYRSCKLNARLDSRAVEIVDKAFSSRKVKISWSAPALVAWAHYKAISIAKQQAEILDGKVFNNIRKITASFVKPRKAQTHSFSVKLKLPLGSESTDILPFCTEATGVTLGSPTYDLQLCTNNIRILLRRFGPMDSFDVLSSDNTNSKIIALAQFRTAEAATMATEDRQSGKPEFLNGSTIAIEHVHWVKYGIPSLQFKTIKASLDGLQAHDKEAKIRYRDRDAQGVDVDPVHIYIYSTDPKALGRLKIASESLISGVLLVSNGRGIWDEYFGTREGAYFIRKLNADSAFFVKCDTRMRTLYFCGPADHLDHVREMVIQQLGDVYAHRHEIPLCRGLIRPLVTGGLDVFRGDIGSGRVSLDIHKPSLTVRGNSSDVKRVQRNLATMDCTSGHRQFWETDEVCPVCACEATGIDPVALPCGHVYCKACLQHLLRSAAGPDFAPPSCVAENHEAGVEKITCGAGITLNVICDMLTSLEETSLLESSFSSYIRSQSENFRQCPTPECQIVYRPGDSGTVLHCPSCRSRICPACHVEFHEGLSCAEYQENPGAYHKNDVHK